MLRKFKKKFRFIFMLCFVGLAMIGCDFSTQDGSSGPKYDVVFKDYDGSILQKVEVVEGNTAIYTGPELKRDGYMFIGWSENLTNVKKDLIVFAVYDVSLSKEEITTEDTTPKFLVTFKNHNGNVLYTTTVKEGSTAVYKGPTPVKANNGFIYYNFKGWDKSLENIVADTIFTAVFEEEDKTPSYTVTFKNYDGSVLSTVSVKHGDTASYNKDTPIKPNDEELGYVFSGWDKSLDNIVKDMEVIAQFVEYDTREEFVVTFKNYNGNVLYTVIVKEGGDATYSGPTPKRPDDGFMVYTFKGWDKTFTNVTENLEVIALYDETDETPSYTVTFKNYDGTVLEEVTVRHGETAVYSESTPTKPDNGYLKYEFSGWDKSLDNITSDLVVTAEFNEVDETPSYTVTFKNYDGTVLEEVTVRHGETAVYSGSNPKKPNNGNIVYTFSKWDSSLENITASKDVYALFDETVTADLSYRVNRDFSGVKTPTNQTNEDKLPLIDQSLNQSVSENNNVYSLINGLMKLDFYIGEDNYGIRLVNTTDSNTMFVNNYPVIINMEDSDSLSCGYSLIETTSYGIRASVSITTTNGSVIEVIDCYYYPQENETGVFNVRRTVKVESLNEADTGFSSEYLVGCANTTNELEWYVPNNVFITPSVASKTYRETYLGIPMMMLRDKITGYTLSLSRYQPVVSYVDNSVASLTYDNNLKNIKVSYPGNGYFHDALEGTQHVYDLSIRASVTENYSVASSDSYNAHFNLQNQRIVNTDIDEVYNVITEDFETFLHKTEQVKISTGEDYYAYGLPWRITIEDGEFGPLTYQAGFVGQQIPAAYNMILHGLMTDDLESLQNGINTINFWVDDAEFMSGTVVPRIWYDTTGGPNGEGQFRSYPVFLRMAVDAMEGLIDAYLVLSLHGIEMDSWWSAIEKFGKFLTNYQNEDGSYYRCYNLDGGPFKDGDNGIEEPDKDRNICQSESKNNTQMAIRILGKYYELTGQEKYKTAALKAGEYVYTELYPKGYYQGGTCDNNNAIDKEAGVYAMYAYDTLYMLTKDSKWLECLKQATAFTMSTVITLSFSVQESDLKSAYPVEHGYTDGMSFITCTWHGVDNYISYIYYELFRVYLLTGDESYLKQAEFIQQNTKSIMNWDGSLGYKYRSLVAEASQICNFTYMSTDDGVWLPWSSVANAEPIAKMYANFGVADVIVANEMYSLDELQSKLFDTIGIGGQYHTLYDSTILDQVE